jgi:hypothetical protein
MKRAANRGSATLTALSDLIKHKPQTTNQVEMKNDDK